MTALPSRPKLGRRERWLAVAVLFVMVEGIAAKLGVTVPVECAPRQITLRLRSCRS